jgi:putative endonuclease
MQKFYVYVLKSLKDGRYYIGSTSDLGRRLDDHSLGKTTSLRNRRPLRLVYKEEFPDRLSARRREKQIKSYKGGEAFKKLEKEFE